MKPIIGVITSTEITQDTYYTTSDNVNAIIQAGGIPLLLPYLTVDTDILEIASKIDGLYATGGYDIDPTLFEEEPHPKLGTIIPSRDIFELNLIMKVLELDKPLLGVCRGSQTLNIALNGDMYQDIYAQKSGDLLQHQQKAPTEHGSHFVHVLEGSLLHQLTGETRLRVNSRHHQANRTVSSPLRVCAKASDGVVEAIESINHRFILGLQWHPENLLRANDRSSKAIFDGFIKACQEV